MRSLFRVIVGIACSICFAVPMRGIGFLGTAQAQDAGQPASPKRNVLFVMADDLREFGGVFTKDHVKLPNLERLRARGVSFDRAYAQYPVCNPSRTSLLTGLRCEETGVVENTTLFRSKLPDVVTLPQLLRNNGWYAASYGKIFHVGEAAGEVRGGWTDEGRSWDEARMFRPTTIGARGDVRDLAPGKLRWCKVGAMDGGDDDQPDGQTAAAAVATIERMTRDGKPWFIGAGFHKPHDPFLAPRKYFALYPKESLSLYRDPESLTPLPSVAVPLSMLKTFAEFTDADRVDFLQAYLAGASYMDAQLGRLLDALDRMSLWESTVVVFLGDHGYHLGERGWWNKNTLFERSCRSPLIIAGAGVRPGQAFARPVEFLDVYPTLAELCGVQPPHTLSGRSLVPVLKDAAVDHKDAAFTLVMRGPTGHGRTVRTERWRFIEWSDGAVELYDHHADPEETRNVASDHPNVTAELAERLKQLPARK